MTESNGGGYFIIWRYDRLQARGGLQMIERIWNDIVHV